MTAVAPEFQSAETSMVQKEWVIARRPRTSGLDLKTARLPELLQWFGAGLTQRELGKEIGVSQGTARRLLLGYGVPTERVLNGIAAWTKLDITEVRKVAGRGPGELRPYVPTPEANQLSLPHRTLIDKMIRTLLETQGPRVTR